MTHFSNINKNNSFGVPDDYFESVTDQIHAKITEEKLKEKYGNKNPFIVPEGYFQNFIVNIETKTKGKLIRMIKPWLSIAAGIFVIFGIWQIVLTALENNDSSVISDDTVEHIEDIQYAEIFDFSNVDEEALEAAINNYIEDSDMNSLSSINEDEEATYVSEETEAIYEYYIDYSDEYSDYEELSAGL